MRIGRAGLGQHEDSPLGYFSSDWAERCPFPTPDLRAGTPDQAQLLSLVIAVVEQAGDPSSLAQVLPNLDYVLGGIPAGLAAAALPQLLEYGIAALQARGAACGSAIVF